MQQGVQTDTAYNIQQCWEMMADGQLCCVRFLRTSACVAGVGMGTRGGKKEDGFLPRSPPLFAPATQFRFHEMVNLQ